jgi:hypothetical protein
MVHIREPRVSGNRAAAGRWTPAASDTPFLTVKGILLVVVGRAASRKEMAAAQSTWDSEGGATGEGESWPTDHEGRPPRGLSR